MGVVLTGAEVVGLADSTAGIGELFCEHSSP